MLLFLLNVNHVHRIRSPYYTFIANALSVTVFIVVNYCKDSPATCLILLQQIQESNCHSTFKKAKVQNWGGGDFIKI